MEKTIHLLALKLRIKYHMKLQLDGKVQMRKKEKDVLLSKKWNSVAVHQRSISGYVLGSGFKEFFVFIEKPHSL